MKEKRKNIGKVPNLRFPEFEGEWESKNIDSLGTFIGGGTPDTSNDEYWSGDIPWISSSDVIEGDVHNILKSRFITDKAIRNSATKIIPKGSVLMVSRVGIGKFAVADENLCTSQDFTNLVTKENEYFICYYFTSQSNRFISLSQGTSIKGLTTNDIKLSKFFIPQSLEQNKIADFLTSMDQRIHTQNEIIQRLESLILGFGQRLFNQQLRFKDEKRNSFPKWEEKELKKCCSFYSGGTPNSTNKAYYSGNIPFIGSGNISDSYVDNFITKEALRTSSAKLVDEGDLLYALYGATSGEVAISKINGAINQAVLCIRTKENTNYLFYSLKHNKGKIVQTYIQGGQGNLSAKIIKELKFNFPCKGEQNKIASFLSKIDNKIQVEKKTLECLIKQKKYFLQQLFI